MPATSLETLAYRHGQGAICLGAFKDGRLIGWLWLCLGPYLEDEVRAYFIPPARTAWDFDVYVAPEYRATFALPRLWDAANQFLQKRGSYGTMSRISALKPESINAHKRLGAISVGWACFLHCRKAQLALSSTSPYVHFSFWRAPWYRLSLPPKNQVTDDGRLNA